MIKQILQNMKKLNKLDLSLILLDYNNLNNLVSIALNNDFMDDFYLSNEQMEKYIKNSKSAKKRLEFLKNISDNGMNKLLELNGSIFSCLDEVSVLCEVSVWEC